METDASCSSLETWNLKPWNLRNDFQKGSQQFYKVSTDLQSLQSKVNKSRFKYKLKHLRETLGETSKIKILETSTLQSNLGAIQLWVLHTDAEIANK